MVTERCSGKAACLLEAAVAGQAAFVGTANRPATPGTTKFPRRSIPLHSHGRTVAEIGVLPQKRRIDPVQHFISRLQSIALSLFGTTRFDRWVVSPQPAGEANPKPYWIHGQYSGAANFNQPRSEFSTIPEPRPGHGPRRLHQSRRAFRQAGRRTKARSAPESCPFVSGPFFFSRLAPARFGTIRATNATAGSG